MVKYQQRKVEYIISGYVRETSNDYIPNDVTVLIYQFFDGLLLFNVYNGDGINIIRKCREIIINCDSFFFISNTHGLFVNGLNQTGQLGVGHIENVEFILKHEFFNDKKIEVISEGISNEHNFIYTKDKELYGFGDNGTSQLFADDTDETIVKEPELMKFNFSNKIIQIKCGVEHSLFLTENGDLFGCGYNFYGQLTKNYSGDEIEKIIDTKNIIHIECCCYISYIVYNDNSLGSFGYNDNGLLGINSDNNIGKSGDINIVCKNIHKISCGLEFMCYLTDNNHLYLLGDNTFGQCGYNCGSQRSTFNEIKSINNDIIIDVKCGGYHSIIKTNKNEFYSFGKNSDDQLLLDINDDRIHTPTLISYKYIYKLIGSSKNILDFVPSLNNTLVVQEM